MNLLYKDSRPYNLDLNSGQTNEYYRSFGVGYPIDKYSNFYNEYRYGGPKSTSSGYQIAGTGEPYPDEYVSELEIDRKKMSMKMKREVIPGSGPKHYLNPGNSHDKGKIHTHAPSFIKKIYDTLNNRSATLNENPFSTDVLNSEKVPGTGSFDVVVDDKNIYLYNQEGVQIIISRETFDDE